MKDDKDIPDFIGAVWDVRSTLSKQGYFLSGHFPLGRFYGESLIAYRKLKKKRIYLFERDEGYFLIVLRQTKYRIVDILDSVRDCESHVELNKLKEEGMIIKPQILDRIINLKIARAI